VYDLSASAFGILFFSPNENGMLIFMHRGSNTQGGLALHREALALLSHCIKDAWGIYALADCLYPAMMASHLR